MNVVLISIAQDVLFDPYRITTGLQTCIKSKLELIF